MQLPLSLKAPPCAILAPVHRGMWAACGAMSQKLRNFWALFGLVAGLA